jgi:hypothetical protein
MKLTPVAADAIEWDDSTPLRLTDWKDVVPRGRLPVSYACDDKTALEVWQREARLEDLAESMRERNTQAMSDERREEYVQQLIDKLTKRIIADGEDPKQLP